MEATDETFSSQLVEISDGLLELYGYTREELEGPGGWTVLVPEDMELVRHISEEHIAKGLGWDGRVRLRTKTGEEVIVETTLEIESDENGRKNIVGRVRDVTEQVALEDQLKERETRLEVLSESFPIVMWSCDTELRFTWSWGSGLKDLGLEENEVVGMSLYEFFGTDEPITPIDAERRALAGEHADYEWTWVGRRYRCWVEPHLDASGAVVGTIGVAIDITEQFSVEQETKAIGRELIAPRYAAEAAWGGGDEVISVGDLRIDIDTYEVQLNGRKVDLTPTEFRLLVELARRPGRVLTRDMLLGRVWGHDFLGGGSLITMAIKRLRSKIETDPSHPEMIETVRGFGYRLRR